MEIGVFLKIGSNRWNKGWNLCSKGLRFMAMKSSLAIGCQNIFSLVRFGESGRA